jgi:hypothetical protein
LESILPTLESKVEQKKAFSVNLMINVDALFGLSNLMCLSKYSSLIRLVRVTAWVMRFVGNLKRKRSGTSLVVEPLEVSELRQAELEWVKVAQSALRDQESYGQLEK